MTFWQYYGIGTGKVIKHTNIQFTSRAAAIDNFSGIAEARAIETASERDSRLDSQRARTAEARAIETVSERDTQLDSQR